MKIIAAAALAGAALLTTALPAHADDGPVDFGIFQGVNDTKGSSSTDTTPRSPLDMLVGNLTSPGGQ